MAPQTRKPRLTRLDATTGSDEALLAQAQEVFRARRLAAEAEQGAERPRRACGPAGRRRRLAAAIGTAIRTSLKSSVLADRLQRRRFNRTEREVLVALVLSQLGLLPNEISTCGDLMALFRHSCRATLAALRSLAEDGRLVRSGLVLVDDDGDVPQREVSIDPGLVEGLVLRGRRRVTWCDVGTEQDLHERLDTFTRALAAKRESLESDPFGHHSLSQAQARDAQGLAARRRS